MSTYFNKFLLKVQKEEQRVNLLPENCVQESSQMMFVLNDILKELKAYVLMNGFDSKNEEMVFFRDVKAVIQGKYLFYRWVYNTEIATNHIDKKTLKKYFTKLQRKLYKKISKQCSLQPFYGYYLSENHMNDHRYFTRFQYDISEIKEKWLLNFDENFSTYYDLLAAEMISENLFSEYLSIRIKNLKETIKIEDLELVWTGSQSDLVELVYALFSTNVINRGGMKIGKMLSIFGKIFKQDLSKASRTFVDIKARVKSRTAFIDRLKKSFEEHMNKELE